MANLTIPANTPFCKNFQQSLTATVELPLTIIDANNVASHLLSIKGTVAFVIYSTSGDQANGYPIAANEHFVIPVVNNQTFYIYATSSGTFNALLIQ